MADRARWWMATLALALAGALATLPAQAAKTPSTRGALRPLLLKDLRFRQGTSFTRTLDRWAADYGSEAVRPLLDIARDKKIPEPQRYIAMMGATRLGGAAIAPSLTGFLKDSSWMLRSAALRALTILRDAGSSVAVLPLLQDKALVVRAEAVEAVRKLKPRGSAEALANCALHSANYHGGKAQWVPVYAIAALREFGTVGAREQLPRLLPLLERAHDEALLKEAVATFEFLEQRKLAPGASLPERAKAWRQAFAKPTHTPS